MLGGLITLAIGMFASLIMHKTIMIKPESYPQMQKVRKLLILATFIFIFPVTIQEVFSGHFDNWVLGLFINSWEMLCFGIGFFWHDFLMNRGWIEQYLVIG